MSQQPVRYTVPAGTVQVEETIKGSRFIGTAGPAPTTEDARNFVDEVSERYKDATHNAWAFQIGVGDSAARGMSDDGEPSGTAGQPILARIEGSGIGDVVVVVTRYFGGTKLGTGGLVRAYGGLAGAALAALETVEKVQTRKIELAGVHYSFYGPIRNLLAEYEGAIIEETFGEAVRLRIEVPLDRIDTFAQKLRNMTAGDVTVPKE